MKLRWFITSDSYRNLQYRDNDYEWWCDVDVEYEVEQPIEYIRKLEERVKELEIDYKALIEARK